MSEQALSKDTITISGVTYDLCGCCGKPKSGTGRRYSHAVFVVKRFVRGGKIVDFPGQWAQLCQAVGFEFLHDHHALLTEEHGSQHTLAGEVETKTVARKSFFRRLHEKKSPETVINWENVQCFRKPL